MSDTEAAIEVIAELQTLAALKGRMAVAQINMPIGNVRLVLAEIAKLRSQLEELQKAAKPKVKPLEWRKSEMIGWVGDYHTVPTNFTVRYADENGWKWSSAGGFGYASSPEAAMADAQAEHERRILSALLPQEKTDAE